MRVNKYKVLLDDNLYPKLHKEFGINFIEDTGRINCPSVIMDLFNKYFNIGSSAQESVYLMCLNNRSKLLGIFHISLGTINSSPICIREIITNTLLVGSNSIIIIHNHPSQDLNPSNADIIAKNRIKDVCNLVDIIFLDFIIIGKTNYFSFNEEGIL